MSREAMQMALDVITTPHPGLRTNLSDAMIYREKIKTTIEALRTALAQPDVPETAFGETKPVAMKFQIYKQTPPRGRELEPIHSALLPWVYDQDPSSGNTASMWVTPVATLPPQREWQGLTDEEIKTCAKGGRSIGVSFHDAICRAEAKLKEKNT